jgi:ABC-2 type transport system ATP-binding protein
MLGLLDLESIVHRPTRVLSLGERMKCEFGMSMLHKPQIVFLDEPTIGVDLIAKESIHAFIREMNQDGVTFILTTHDLEDIVRLAGRVIIINHGEKVFEDELSVLRRSLGDKRTVRIATKGPMPGLECLLGDGVSVIGDVGDREAMLEVDNALMPMNDFMSRLASLGEIQDISINEMDIDKVIKAIYVQ